jgi:hypothetical protein
MRMSRFAALAVLALTVVCLATPRLRPGAPQGNKVFSGEIMDSQCAAMGSHQQMMKPEGAKDAKECTLKCVAMGGRFVLYDSANKAVYQLDDQDKAKQFAGRKVKVSGSFAAATKSIHMQNVKAAP